MILRRFQRHLHHAVDAAIRRHQAGYVHAQPSRDRRPHLFEIEDRYRALDHKLTVVQDNLSIFVDLTQRRRGL